jgi:hypothetical protein
VWYAWAQHTRCATVARGNSPGFPHSHPTRSMSSPSSNLNVSSFQFQDLLDAALREYKQKTGKDIATDPLTARFFDCKSSDAVLGILEEQALAFDQFRKGDGKVQLMRCLEPIVDILLGLSTSSVAEGISLVRLPRSNYPLWKFIITLQIFPPASAVFSGVGFLLAVRIHFPRLCLWP